MHFLWKAHHSLLALRDTRQHFGTMLGGYFQQKNQQQKAPKWEKHGTKQTVKRILFTGGDLKPEGRASPCSTWERVHLATQSFHLSAHVCE